jgi:hypothetical protein
MRPEERDASAVDFAPVSDADDEHGYLFVQHFVDDTVITDAQPPQAGELPLRVPPARGSRRRRSIAWINRERSAWGIRLSDLAALALILIEKLTLHVFPVQDGIGRILEPLEAELEVFDVIEVILDRLPNDLGPGPVKPACRAVDLLNELCGKSGAELRHGITPECH